MYKWILPEVVQSKFLTYFIRNRQESWTCSFKNLEISKLLEKERERERQTDRQTDRQTERVASASSTLLHCYSSKRDVREIRSIKMLPFSAKSKPKINPKFLYDSNKGHLKNIRMDLCWKEKKNNFAIKQLNFVMNEMIILKNFSWFFWFWKRLLKFISSSANHSLSLQFKESFQNSNFHPFLKSEQMERLTNTCTTFFTLPVLQ